MMTLSGPSESTQPMPAWRLWIPLLVQTAMILAIPTQSVYTRLVGKTVVLQTVPVDPYSLLQGYSVMLRYDISRIDTLKYLPGWTELKQHGLNAEPVAPGTSLYVILEQPTSSTSANPVAWKPVRVSRDRPAAIAANQVALKGIYNYGLIKHGLETYFIPEEQRVQIGREIPSSWQGEQQSTLVEIKVDARGHAAPISFWVGNPRTGQRHNYRF